MIKATFARPTLLSKLRPTWRNAAAPKRPLSTDLSTHPSTPGAQTRRLDLPEKPTSAEDSLRQQIEARGQFLARQDRWEELGEEIRAADQSRDCTPGGMGLADLLARGARLDVVQPVEQILSDPALLPQHAPREGISALEEVLEDHPEDFGVALVLIQAHIDFAWAWRGEGWHDALPPQRQHSFLRHMARAEALLDRFSPFEHDSPALAACRCALLAAAVEPDARLADDYEDLIDLDPGNPRHMRAFGNHLLPRWFGSYQMLEVEARRVALMTEDLWGAGGYAWVYLDALSVDPGALELLDADFFLDGMRDILERAPDQHVVNTWAAFCAVTLPALPAHRRATREGLSRLRAALDWIQRDHLQELHPLIWGQAKLGLGAYASLPSIEELTEMGRTAAQNALAPQPA
ncbi:hypothetical protein TL5118_00636 [Thalassovita autumnalis]|uniref:DUF4034 domain-containing protein n=1 Tax=Thalassovita autumnalis TaxID=2072972 RepID=A0A0N7LUL6_9RHOB|nr:hypothetical protein [Thalassovita autumnalis]CUH63842.1 hypothetical protein TL5118_00636 [Thalassovita autumnalis]CUH72707.1 hypothetical protein TL5120_02504 [Thalassovita autumnalis]